MQADKVTFAQAAKVLNLHPNTLKNWQKAGKLATAEKGKVNGVITWLVDFDEVTAINEQNFAILDAVGPYTPPQDHQEAPGPAEQPQPDLPSQPQQTTQIQPNIEATLTIFRESVVAPLTALIKEQGSQIGDLKEEVGTLKERLRNLEAQLEAARLATAAQEAQKPPATVETPPPAQHPPQTAYQPEPSPILNRDTLQPVTTENRKSFWRWLGDIFGG